MKTWKACFVVFLIFIFEGCSAVDPGITHLGTYTFPDGSQKDWIGVRTGDSSANELTLLEGHRTAEGKTYLENSEKVGGPGTAVRIGEALIYGPLTAGIIGGSNVGASAVRRPDRTNVTQSGGGASASTGAITTQGGAGGDASASTGAITTQGGAGGAGGTATSTNTNKNCSAGDDMGNNNCN